MTCKCCCNCECHKSEGYGSGIPAYKLLKDMPEACAGTIFVLTNKIRNVSGFRDEWLTNAWDKRNCQAMGRHLWAAGVIVLPDIAVNTTWFERIVNNGEYSY